MPNAPTPVPTTAPRETPTKAEREAQYAAFMASADDMLKAHEGVLEDSKGKRNVSGSITCPRCLGILRYRIAHNKHSHALCETEGCLSWME